MRMYDLILKKKEGAALSKEEIQWMINAFTTGEIPDYQMSAMLMAICFQGMNHDETLALTLAMRDSGDVLDLSGIKGVKVDKHSTGGVGDKTSLILTPIIAALGVPVAKMSGRGLGHTGGTIDKLECFEGFSTSISEEAFLKQVSEVGVAIAGQTANLAPADKKLYADKADFADCYPFIPYQFNLLGQVLTAVRTHGASGKHLSDQSRSMLALFQESAIRVMDKEDGVLVPFSFFYDPLHKFIDHQHSQVISDAENNSKLDEFDVELLKVLFMIKYVKEIKANVDNLTTLMISNIDDERIEVRSKIEESLKKLIKETLVQKNGEIYIFLTNEEQEINNAINNESVEMGEIIGEASTVIFEEIYTEKKYRYSNRYDRFLKGNQSNDIGVTVITPYGGDYADSALRLLSAQESSVIVKLPNDSTFLDEITESIKIYKFLNKNASGARGSFDSIRRAKEDERIEKKDRIRIFIEDALKNADI